MTLTLHTPPSVPLEAETLSPERLQGLSETEVATLPVLHGNRHAELGDFFHVQGSCDGELRLEGNLERVKLIGCGMTSGRIIIDGNAGMHLGAAMRGGQIEVEGNASDWVGAEMEGGRIIVKGDAGHLIGSAYRGNLTGMKGGEIIVYGKAGNEIGNAMRRGLIAVGGSAGDFTGVNLLAGTIIVLGELGWRSGASMKRGTIVSMQDARILPTFNYASTYQPVFLRMYLLHLRRLGLPVEDTHIDGQYRRWSGDGLELNRGEILLLQR